MSEHHITSVCDHWRRLLTCSSHVCLATKNPLQVWLSTDEKVCVTWLLSHPVSHTVTAVTAYNSLLVVKGLFKNINPWEQRPILTRRYHFLLIEVALHMKDIFWCVEQDAVFSDELNNIIGTTFHSSLPDPTAVLREEEYTTTKTTRMWVQALY